MAASQLRRLLRPETLVVVGGRAAEAAVQQCRSIGYDGEIWGVHPTRQELGGVPCYPELSQLPGVPDAAFVAVSRERTVGVVAELARLGVGGAVCHASGFAESGAYGADLEEQLVSSAGDMALVGPNCLGLLNYLDGAALWCEQHGGSRVESGVAVIAQSGNIAQNLTMQRRSVPLAQVVTIGNSAVTGVVELIAGMLDDPRITAIGLHLEQIPDVADLSEVALEALRRGVPIVALKAGISDVGARVTLSHTASMAGSDTLVDALFRRVGIGRVHDLETFLETLKFLHVTGGARGSRIASASCSGGEAAHVADLAHGCGLTVPDFAPATRDRLEAILGDRVLVRNPLDYHTYIWGDPQALTACFAAFLGSDVDSHLLLLDFPRTDRCDVSEFETTVAAFEAAHRQQPQARACIVASLPEGMPEAIGERLLSAGVAPMQGVGSCLSAIRVSAQIAAARDAVEEIRPLPRAAPATEGPVAQLDEHTAKSLLASYGIAVPRSLVAHRRERVAGLASEIGFPVVLKTLSVSLAHKSEVGGVRVGLRDRDDVERAVASMAELGDDFLVEAMIDGVVLELMVGIHRDLQFGLVMTVGVGGIFVELLADTVNLLLPATRADICTALHSLQAWPLLAGFRDRQVDLDAVVDALEAVMAVASDHAERLVELEVNPLLVLADGAVAVDALIRLADLEDSSAGVAS